MKKKKRKIKLKSIIILLLIIIIIGLLIYWFLNIKVTNIYVKGNNLLKESYVIKKTKLDDYPKIYKVNTKKIEELLSKEILINKVTVSKSLLGKVIIEIKENVPLLKISENTYILSNGRMEELDIHAQVPFLQGEVSADIYDDFTSKFALINHDILIKISEVKYDKTELDNERFLLYMNDGNMVYVTLSKIERINTYNEIYPTLEDKKGILYLDSGNHFEIKSDGKTKEKSN